MQPATRDQASKTQHESDCQGKRFNKKSAMVDYRWLRLNRNPPDEDY